MNRPPEPVFLERRTYRLRRLGDAARLLPVIGLVLLFVPILWGPEATTHTGLIYLFSVWAVLILAVFLLSRRLMAAEREARKSASVPARKPGG